MSKNNFDKKFEDLEKFVMNEMRNIYSEKAIEYSMQPRNVGIIENPDGYAKIKGPCGDTMEIYLKIEDDCIKDAKFFTDGCGATIACGSAVTEIAKGKSIKEVLKISPNDVLDFLDGLPEENIHCSILSVNTLHTALAIYFLLKNLKKGEE
jgi:nitrogen fixation NifU-like protein